MAKKNKIFLGLVLLLVFLSFPKQLAPGSLFNDCENYLINKIRCQAGVNPVALNLDLNQSALAKATLLESGEIQWGEHAHDGFSNLIRNFNNNFVWFGEDLARNFNTEEEVYAAWVNSPKHYEIMTDPKAKYFGYACANQYCVLHLAKD